MSLTVCRSSPVLHRAGVGVRTYHEVCLEAMLLVQGLQSCHHGQSLILLAPNSISVPADLQLTINQPLRCCMCDNAEVSRVYLMFGGSFRPRRRSLVVGFIPQSRETAFTDRSA